MQDVADQSILAALKCDLRDDRNVRERLARYNKTTVQYEEGLAVARRIRASRYLGVSTIFIMTCLLNIMSLSLSQNAAQNIIGASQKSSTRLHVYP